MSDNDQSAKFFPVDVSGLRTGMFSERTLYLYLKANGRYVRFVNAFHPLEETKLEKMKKHGQVFAAEASVAESFPSLDSTALKIKNICEDARRAPFEKNLEVHQITAWVFHALFSASTNPSQKYLPLLLVNKAFAKPTETALLQVSEESIEIYETALLHASLSALTALWLGYSNADFLNAFLETVFKESVRAGSGTYERFDGDELSQILAFSKTCVKDGFKPLSSLQTYRIARKLLKIFPENLESKDSKKDSTEPAEVAA